MGNSCISLKKENSNNNQKNLIEWKASSETCRYHWWPMKDINENDTANNLYAVGVDDKYDQL